MLEVEEVPTAGFVLDVSQLGSASLLDQDGVERFATLSVDNPRNAEDALLAMTAEAHGAVLVTDDTRLRGRAKASGIQAVDADTFTSRVR